MSPRDPLGPFRCILDPTHTGRCTHIAGLAHLDDLDKEETP